MRNFDDDGDDVIIVSGTADLMPCTVGDVRDWEAIETAAARRRADIEQERIWNLFDLRARMANESTRR